ncbi:unnamed protein product, partial [Mesorhabditis spiculigera]
MTEPPSPETFVTGPADLEKPYKKLWDDDERRYTREWAAEVRDRIHLCVATELLLAGTVVAWATICKEADTEIMTVPVAVLGGLIFYFLSMHVGFAYWFTKKSTPILILDYLLVTLAGLSLVPCVIIAATGMYSPVHFCVFFCLIPLQAYAAVIWHKVAEQMAAGEDYKQVGLLCGLRFRIHFEVKEP